MRRKSAHRLRRRGAQAAAAPGAAGGLIERLTDFLRRILPAYMVPARIMVLDRLPTRVERQDRPSCVTGSRCVHTQLRCAAGPAEIAMAHLWSDILNVPQVGVTDDFFSSAAIRCCVSRSWRGSARRKAFGIEIEAARSASEADDPCAARRQRLYWLLPSLRHRRRC